MPCCWLAAEMRMTAFGLPVSFATQKVRPPTMKGLQYWNGTTADCQQNLSANLSATIRLFLEYQRKLLVKWCQRQELNLRPKAYESYPHQTDRNRFLSNRLFYSAIRNIPIFPRMSILTKPECKPECKITHRATGTTLGMMIRALRLGFAPIPGRVGFMRLTGGENGKPFLCELWPFGLIPNSAKTDGPHWCWWKDAYIGALDVELIEGIRNLRRVKLPFSFYFDDEGNTLHL